MSLAPTVNAPTQGDVGGVCLLLSTFIGGAKQAEVDLKLTEGALPGASKMLLSTSTTLGQQQQTGDDASLPAKSGDSPTTSREAEVAKVRAKVGL